MAKRRSSGAIPIEINEIKSASDTRKVEIRVKDVLVGTVEKEEGAQAIATLYSGKQQNVPTIDDGIESVLMDYNLHNL